MNIAKKIVVIVPVLVIGCIYTYMYHFQQIQHAGSKRLVALFISVLLFYIWAVIGVARRKQDSFFDIVLQSSFYIYIFSVLTLTGYFVLFNQVSAHNWWHKLIHRVNARDGVNLEPFIFMKARHLLNYEVVGNFIILLPLGIYLPLLYKKIKNFFTVTFVAMLVSVAIELMQLATNFRITDIDDVILNTAGASLGFIIYFIVYTLLIKPLDRSQQYQMSEY